MDVMYERHLELQKFLEDSRRTSFAIQVNEEFRRSLVLAAASYFEGEIQKIVMEHAALMSNNRPEIISVFATKVVKRQYHTWFNWDDLRDSAFWAMFGGDFKTAREKEMKANQDLHNSSKAFLEIGRLRNNIVHRNFAEFTVDKTIDEIYTLYRNARLYIEYCSMHLNRL